VLSIRIVHSFRPCVRLREGTTSGIASTIPVKTLYLMSTEAPLKTPGTTTANPI
jgi:hypothetical protein